MAKQNYSLVESMRSSSPTRRYTPSHAKEYNSWIVHHPPALKMFDQIVDASKGKQIVVFLDYDGTLAPIVNDPDKAFMSDSMRDTVRKLARCFPTAIVTGRCKAKICNFVRLPELYYAASNGLNIEGPPIGTSKKAIVYQPPEARDFPPIINEVHKKLADKIKHIPKATLENNEFCLSVHYRNVDEKYWEDLAKKTNLVLQDYKTKLCIKRGRMVFEIRPMIDWNKGKAVEFLLESLGFSNSSNVFPLYIGDDQSDEDAFMKLRQRGQGFGILVSKASKDTSASYSLKDPDENLLSS